MIEITPIQFPIGDLIATKFMLSVNSFTMDAITATFYYAILTDEGIELSRGNLSMTEQEFSLWLGDNSYCVDWALSKLGLSRLN